MSTDQSVHAPRSKPDDDGCLGNGNVVHFYVTSKPRAMRNTDKNSPPTSVALHVHTEIHIHSLILVLRDRKQEGSGILLSISHTKAETLTF